MTAGLNLIVADIQVKNPVITVSVIIEKNMNFNSATDAIKATLFRVLSPVQFSDAEDKLRKSFIISSIMSVSGVIYVPSFSMTCSGTTASGDDLQFTNKGVLPELLASDLTLTVTYL